MKVFVKVHMQIMIGHFVMENVSVGNAFPFSFFLITFLLYKVLCLNHSRNYYYNAVILDFLLFPCGCWAFSSVLGVFCKFPWEKEYIHITKKLWVVKVWSCNNEQKTCWIVEMLVGKYIWRPSSPASCLKQDYHQYYNIVPSSRITLYPPLNTFFLISSLNIPSHSLWPLPVVLFVPAEKSLSPSSLQYQ